MQRFKTAGRRAERYDRKGHWGSLRAAGRVFRFTGNHLANVVIVLRSGAGALSPYYVQRTNRRPCQIPNWHSVR